MNRFRIMTMLFGALLSLPAFAVLPRELQNACEREGFHWSKNTSPVINVRWIFCGEQTPDRKGVGFHSVLLKDSAPIFYLDEKSKRYYGNGLYEATVEFANGFRKTSVFFPEHCDYKQIVKSVEYAANHTEAMRDSPSEQRGWSADPKRRYDQNRDMCLGTDGQPFKIQMTKPNLIHGVKQLNAAFPVLR